MRHPVPLIHEDEPALKQRRQHAHAGHTKPRLPRLYLRATRPAQDRQAVARRLGVQRQTLSRWLARYAAGGLDAVLATDGPAGHPVSLVPDVLASLEPALHRPEGVAASEALRQGGRRTPGGAVQDNTLDTLVGVRFNTKRKVARPRPTQQA